MKFLVTVIIAITASLSAHADTLTSKTVRSEFNKVRAELRQYTGRVGLVTRDNKSTCSNNPLSQPFYCRFDRKVGLSPSWLAEFDFTDRPSIRAVSGYYLGFAVMFNELGSDVYANFTDDFESESLALATCISGAYTKEANDKRAFKAQVNTVFPALQGYITSTGNDYDALVSLYRLGAKVGVDGCFDLDIFDGAF